VTSKRL